MPDRYILDDEYTGKGTYLDDAEAFREHMIESLDFEIECVEWNTAHRDEIVSELSPNKVKEFLRWLKKAQKRKIRLLQEREGVK